MPTTDHAESVRSALLELISQRQLDYEAAVDALASQFGRDAVEGVIFELSSQGHLQDKAGVLRPSRRRDDRLAPSGPPRWEYKLIEAPFSAQLLDKLNPLGEQGWEVVGLNLEQRGTLVAQQYVALLKRRKPER